jgi:hypothetical protein
MFDNGTLRHTAANKYPHHIKVFGKGMIFSGSSDVSRDIILLVSITNKMQRYTVFFITVNAVHVSGGFSAHHQEHKTVHTTSGICQACFLLPLPVATSKLDIFQMKCVQF